MTCWWWASEAVGAAALAHLAARGASVVGVEQGDVPSEHGSSVGETRIIRKAYFEDPRYVPLLERAYVLWAELEARAKEQLLVRTGCLNLGRPDHPAILGGLIAQTTRGGAARRFLGAWLQAGVGDRRDRGKPRDDRQQPLRSRAVQSGLVRGGR